MLQAPWLQAREGDDARPALRNLSKAFTQVAQDAMPAVVFIQVEKLLDAGQSPFGYNNPFDLFGEEFFERFFGRRFPISGANAARGILASILDKLTVPGPRVGM